MNDTEIKELLKQAQAYAGQIETFEVEWKREVKNTNYYDGNPLGRQPSTSEDVFLPVVKIKYRWNE